MSQTHSILPKQPQNILSDYRVISCHLISANSIYITGSRSVTASIEGFEVPSKWLSAVVDAFRSQCWQEMSTASEYIQKYDLGCDNTELLKEIAELYTGSFQPHAADVCSALSELSNLLYQAHLGIAELDHRFNRAN